MDLNGEPCIAVNIARLFGKKGIVMIDLGANLTWLKLLKSMWPKNGVLNSKSNAVLSLRIPQRSRSIGIILNMKNKTKLKNFVKLKKYSSLGYIKR